MYCSLRKITNVRGRADYITNEKRQENIIAVSSTVDNQEEFVRTLARESQQRFAEYNSNKNAKCIEAREFIIGLPNNFQNDTYKDIAQILTENFKKQYGVDCIGAIHCKNLKGQKNIHLHLLFSERPTLKVPEKQPEIKATRNLYYDENGKRCKKANAVKTIKKGDLIRKGYTRHFEDKIKKFKTKEFIDEYQKYISEQLSMPRFDKSRHYATKHIGKNNPKKKHIEEYNDLILGINKTFDNLENKDLFKNTTPKKEFNKMLQHKKIKKLTTKILKSCFNEFLDKVSKFLPLNELDNSQEEQEQDEQDEDMF